MFYDYIRNVKPAFIRYVKNIPFFVASACIIIFAIAMLQPKEKPVEKKPAASGASYDKKLQMNDEKKNSILRRFIAYNQ